jgi:2-methylisocitrate lyase-like PEP mutase family enzyme/predicted alpha/beta hydrolase family esterase
LATLTYEHDLSDYFLFDSLESVRAMTRALILPGLFNSGPEHWQSRWERDDPSLVRVVQRDWDTPERDEWVATLEAAVAAAGPDVVLVAHSTGCPLVAFWAARTSRRVRGALLVAPSDTDAPSYPDGPTGWRPMPLVPLPFKSVVVASSNDQFCSLDRARAFARAWGSRFVQVGDAGHINADSGMGSWPDGQALLADLLLNPEPMTQFSQRVQAFRQLHQAGCFMIPNPWDPGSARLLASLGFRALATTSSGIAWSLGRRDNHVTLNDALAHIRGIVNAVDLPVNADFEGGFAVEPEGVAANVTAAIKTGIAGISIEDSTGDPASPLFDFELSVERVAAARRAIDASLTGVVLTARSEGFFVGRPDIKETVRRLIAYADAGADCLYAPGIRTESEICSVVHAVMPKPVNVLVGGDYATVADLKALGVRRISTGGALARAAWAGFLDAAREIAERGTFTRLSFAVPFDEINGAFAM